jgi:hypothetical protein
MHRIARKDLEALVYVAITCAPPLIKRGMKSKLLDERDKARGELARMICERIDNDSYMVIVTEMIGEAHKRYRGKWGVDEPVPATVPLPPRPPQEAVTK